jgi:NAD(P)-dependent dehydrogenase (short-subunit alcohol dehydrogenase family)
MRLKDKAIIVTGSAVGIGAAIARRIVAEGGQVLVHGLEEHEGRTLVAELGSAAAWCFENLEQVEAPVRIAAAARDAFGRIDGIVNCAARVARSTIDSTDAEFFDRMIATNLRAPLLIIKAAIADLRASRGSVLNIGSVNAYGGEPTLLDYAISKGGLLTMTRNLADGLSTEGVRVNQINPGWVLTEREDRFQRQGGQPDEWYKKQPKWATPSGNLIMPETIAAGCVYWLSDESRPITGSVVELEQFPFLGRIPSKV